MLKLSRYIILIADILNSLWPLKSLGLATKPETVVYLNRRGLTVTPEDSPATTLTPSPPPPSVSSMVETSSPVLGSRSSPNLHQSNSLANNNNHNINSISHNNNNLSPAVSPNYLTTAMLLNSQSCGYLGQRLQHAFQQQQHQLHQHQQQLDEARSEAELQPRSTTSATTPTSLFTIDSILAPKPNQARRSESPVSPSGSATTSPVRPQRVPAMLHHPGLHLGHLAAAAASGFAAPSDFLGRSCL